MMASTSVQHAAGLRPGTAQRSLACQNVQRHRPVTSRLLVQCSTGQQDVFAAGRTALLGAGVALATTLLSHSALATGLESFALPTPSFENPKFMEELAESSRRKLAEADEQFEGSELLRTLRERSEQNKDKYRKELADKYCQRQGEMGVGDCGGLRFIPGATKNGKQLAPSWLQALLGIEEPEPPKLNLFGTPAAPPAAPEAPAVEEAAVEAAAFEEAGVDGAAVEEAAVEAPAVEALADGEPEVLEDDVEGVEGADPAADVLEEVQE